MARGADRPCRDAWASSPVVLKSGGGGSRRSDRWTSATRAESSRPARAITACAPPRSQNGPPMASEIGRVEERGRRLAALRPLDVRDEGGVLEAGEGDHRLRAPEVPERAADGLRDRSC